MNLINFFKKIFKSNEVEKKQVIEDLQKDISHFSSNIENQVIEDIKEGSSDFSNNIEKGIEKKELVCENTRSKNIDKDTLRSITYKGKWKASDMRFVQLWNNDQYEPEKRNFTRRMLIYRTPAYKSVGDENGGSDNSSEESISLTVNVEEGKVFLEKYSQAAKIFENKKELELFINEAQKKFDNELDMGKERSNFIFGWGGKMASLNKYDNPNIQYIPLTFPNNEKFRIPNYKKRVEWDLIEKGAIMVIPKEGEQYLAVIQRKDKPRNLKPFSRYIIAKKERIVKSQRQM